MSATFLTSTPTRRVVVAPTKWDGKRMWVLSVHHREDGRALTPWIDDWLMLTDAEVRKLRRLLR